MKILIVLLSMLAASVATAIESNLTFAITSFPDNRGNPFSSSSITVVPYWSAIFDPLVLITTYGKVEPWLAIKWEALNATTWRITLRPNVTFSDDEPLTSAAIETAIAYLKSDRGAKEPIAREMADIVSVHAVDAMTVDFTIRQPDPLLPRKLSLLRLPAPEQFTKLGPEGFSTAPAGTGPYRLVKNTPTVSNLEAVPTSWRRAPTKTLTFVASPEGVGRRNAVMTGQADVAVGAVSPDDIEDLKGTGTSVFVDELPTVVAMAFNTVKAPVFRDVRVRKAITMAIDREAIVRLFVGADSVVANQPARHSAFGYNNQVQTLPHDPAAARQLLREAGYPNGFAFDLEMPAGTVIYVNVFQQTANDLAKIGVKMTIHIIPNQELVSNMQTGNWHGQAFPLPLFTPANDALYPMRQNSCMWPAPWYCDQAATAMIEDAWREPDMEIRRKKTEAVMARAASDAQAAFLYESLQYMLLGPRVKKFRSDFAFVRYEMLEIAP